MAFWSYLRVLVVTTGLFHTQMDELPSLEVLTVRCRPVDVEPPAAGRQYALEVFLVKLTKAPLLVELEVVLPVIPEPKPNDWRVTWIS
jgi:hypothetical protein